MTTLRMTETEFADFLAGLFERDDRLERRRPGEAYAPDETVDAWVLSAHAEALHTAEFDGDLPGTLADLELDVDPSDEAAAWAAVRAFYLDRGHVLLQVEGEGEDDEWIFHPELLARLGLHPEGDPGEL